MVTIQHPFRGSKMILTSCPPNVHTPILLSEKGDPWELGHRKGPDAETTDSQQPLIKQQESSALVRKGSGGLVDSLNSREGVVQSWQISNPANFTLQSQACPAHRCHLLHVFTVTPTPPTLPYHIKEEICPSTLSSPKNQSSKVEVRVREGRAVNIHMFCACRPGLPLSTMRALDKLGLDVQQAVISCFNGFALDVFRAEQSREGRNVLPEQIKAALLDTVGFYGMMRVMLLTKAMPIVALNCRCCIACSL
ncbi:hypothetical protein VNO77_44725 [Canavalia gladiata]|uniref:Plant bHLH transcription factor ACT-like domain-containing protein n=1 Tax=Canavalia gladiata TaxID=3824 RepID=A0AAN9PQP1_CANGL